MKERIPKMGSMNLIDKVLQGLKCCTECKGESCRKCPYAEEMPTDTPMCMPEMAADCSKVIKQLQADNQRLDKENQKLLEQNIELNRVQNFTRPRVLTIGEIDNFIHNPVYFENQYMRAWAILTEHEGDAIRLLLEEMEMKRWLENYGIGFRIWNTRPSDEQRKSVPWEEGE